MWFLGHTTITLCLLNAIYFIVDAEVLYAAGIAWRTVPRYNGASSFFLGAGKADFGSKMPPNDSSNALLAFRDTFGIAHFRSKIGPQSVFCLLEMAILDHPRKARFWRRPSIMHYNRPDVISSSPFWNRTLVVVIWSLFPSFWRTHHTVVRCGCRGFADGEEVCDL